MKNVSAKLCSRCNKGIQCNMNNIENCLCYQVTISMECVDYLKNTRYNCLCNKCLIELDQLVKKAENSTLKPTENIHYYLENGLLVFTELNHIQRGYCCKSNCRHCAYGYNQK